MTSWILIGVVAAVLVFVVIRNRPDISGQMARLAVRDGARLVDVRSAGEYASGHLPGSTNVPVGELPGRASELEPKGEPIVVYCQSGMRSAQAARVLRSAGFTDVRNLGGIGRW